MHATTSFRHPSPIKPLHAATYVVTGNTLMESLMLPMIEGPKLTDPWGLRSVQYFYRLGAETLVWIYLNTHISLLSITPAPSACFVPVSTKIRERWVPEGWWERGSQSQGHARLGGSSKPIEGKMLQWKSSVLFKFILRKRLSEGFRGSQLIFLSRSGNHTRKWEGEQGHFVFRMSRWPLTSWVLSHACPFLWKLSAIYNVVPLIICKLLSDTPQLSPLQSPSLADSFLNILNVQLTLYTPECWGAESCSWQRFKFFRYLNVL